MVTAESSIRVGVILARLLSTFACAVALGLPAAPATAQTAGDINRLNVAIQVCNSPMGAGMADCAKLRGQLGSGGLGGGLGGGSGGGKGAAAAGLLDALNAAMGPRAAPAVSAPPSASPQLIAACVRAAGGNTQAIQACLAAASAPRLAAPAAPRLGQPIVAGQSCLPLLNGGQPR